MPDGTINEGDLVRVAGAMDQAEAERRCCSARAGGSSLPLEVSDSAGGLPVY